MASTQAQGGPPLIVPPQQMMAPLVEQAPGTQLVDMVGVRPHLRLGITADGFTRVMRDLGLLTLSPEEPSRWVLMSDWIRGDELVSLRRTYPENEAWLAQQFPDTLTCYDVNVVIRMRNSDERTQNQSWLEKLLDRCPDEWSSDIGPADFFLSHVQAEHPDFTLAAIKQVAFNIMTNRPGPMLKKMKTQGNFNPRAWIDLTSLRQSESDFQIDEIVSLVREVGAVVASIDEQHAYLDRSFTLLEVYAALIGEAELVMTISNSRSSLLVDTEPLERLPTVVSANAQCRHDRSRTIIAQYIHDNIGFEAFDRKLNRAIQDRLLQIQRSRTWHDCCLLGVCCPRTVLCWARSMARCACGVRCEILCTRVCRCSTHLCPSVVAIPMQRCCYLYICCCIPEGRRPGFEGL